MNFNPIDIQGMTTFIGMFQVSEESVTQCKNLFKIMNPTPGKTGTGIDKKKKDSLDLTMVPNHTLKIQKEIESCLDIYIHYFNLETHMPPLGMTQHFNIQQYPLMGAYHSIHADRGFNPGDMFRELVWMTYLNDVPSGGETEFMFYKLKIQPKQGLTLIWPAGWTHLHRGLPSLTTEKMIATGWFSPL